MIANQSGVKISDTRFRPTVCCKRRFYIIILIGKQTIASVGTDIPQAPMSHLLGHALFRQPLFFGNRVPRARRLGGDEGSGAPRLVSLLRLERLHRPARVAPGLEAAFDIGGPFDAHFHGGFCGEG